MSNGNVDSVNRFLSTRCRFSTSRIAEPSNCGSTILQTFFVGEGRISPGLLLLVAASAFLWRTMHFEFAQNLIVEIKWFKMHPKFKSCCFEKTNECWNRWLTKIALVGRNHGCRHADTISKFLLTEAAPEPCELQQSS